MSDAMPTPSPRFKTHTMKGALAAAEHRRLQPPKPSKRDDGAQQTEAVSPEAYRPRRGYTLFDEMIDFFDTLRVPEGPLLGQPWVLLPYQRDTIAALCDPTVRRVIVSIPRKGGKTAFAAALLLATICGPLARLNSQVYSAARSRDQAALVFELAVKIINVTPWMQTEVHPTHSRKFLKGLRYNIEYRALSADAKRQHGLSPVFAIHDELGQVKGPTDELYDAIETAFGAQASPKSLIISTQAAEDDDLLSTLIDDAIASGDQRTRVILYAAGRDEDPWSEATWRKCHPAFGLFRNPVEFREAAERAQRLPSAELSFRRYYLNQRIVGETGLVTPVVWRDNARPVDEALFTDGRAVYGGLDLSAKQDLTAAAFVCEDDDGDVHVLLRAWTPQATILERASRDRTPYLQWVNQGDLLTTPGASVGLDWVVADLSEATTGMNLQSLAYDRWRINEFKGACVRAGVEFPLNECGQGFRDMGPCVEALTEMLLNRKVRHGGNPVLTSAAASAVLVRDPAGNAKIDKGRVYGRVDPVIALAMSIGELRKRPSRVSAALPILVW